MISGEKRAVEEVSVAAGESGAKKVVPLPVSAAFHSPLMESAAIELKELLAEAPLVRAEDSGSDERRRISGAGGR